MIRIRLILLLTAALCAQLDSARAEQASPDTSSSQAHATAHSALSHTAGIKGRGRGSAVSSGVATGTGRGKSKGKGRGKDKGAGKSLGVAPTKGKGKGRGRGKAAGAGPGAKGKGGGIKTATPRKLNNATWAAAVGPKCYRAVDWAMRTGVVEHPERCAKAAVISPSVPATCPLTSTRRPVRTGRLAHDRLSTSLRRQVSRSEPQLVAVAIPTANLPNSAERPLPSGCQRSIAGSPAAAVVCKAARAERVAAALLQGVAAGQRRDCSHAVVPADEQGGQGCQKEVAGGVACSQPAKAAERDAMGAFSQQQRRAGKLSPPSTQPARLAID